MTPQLPWTLRLQPHRGPVPHLRVHPGQQTPQTLTAAFVEDSCCKKQTFHPIISFIPELLDYACFRLRFLDCCIYIQQWNVSYLIVAVKYVPGGGGVRVLQDAWSMFSSCHIIQRKDHIQWRGKMGHQSDLQCSNTNTRLLSTSHYIKSNFVAFGMSGILQNTEEAAMDAKETTRNATPRTIWNLYTPWWSYRREMEITLSLPVLRISSSAVPPPPPYPEERKYQKSHLCLTDVSM